MNEQANKVEVVKLPVTIVKQITRKLSNGTEEKTFEPLIDTFIDIKPETEAVQMALEYTKKMLVTIGVNFVLTEKQYRHLAKEKARLDKEDSLSNKVSA